MRAAKALGCLLAAMVVWGTPLAASAEPGAGTESPAAEVRGEGLRTPGTALTRGVSNASDGAGSLPAAGATGDGPPLETSEPGSRPAHAGSVGSGQAPPSLSDPDDPAEPVESAPPWIQPVAGIAVGMLAVLTARAPTPGAQPVRDHLLLWPDPLAGSWLWNLGSFALVACIGVAMARRAAATRRENLLLAERANSLARLNRLHERNYQLLETRIAEAKAARHDLRHHLNAISALVDGGQYDRLAAYVRDVSTPSPKPIEYSANPVVGALVSHFAAIADQAGVRLTLGLNVGPAPGVPAPDLSTVLSNLLENALESCSQMPADERRIGLVMIQKPSALIIRLENSAAGSAPAPEGGFRSAKAPGRRGHGLESIRLVAARHGGYASFAFDPSAKVFRSTVLLPLRSG